MKLARQYHLEKENPEPERTCFISRNESYHGITIGALAISGHVTRKEKFKPLLKTEANFVSACNPYRGKVEGESDAAYVQRLADELDAEFQRVGPNTVIAFVAETVVGAALGAVPPVPGYFKAMREVCDKYGALLVIDEVMCGMGRTGKMHAWMDEGVVPDLQMIGKGLGGGYIPVAGVIVYDKVVKALGRGSGYVTRLRIASIICSDTFYSAFAHGQTYQAHPMGCAAVVAVQKIYREENLLDNVKNMGKLLGDLLHEALDDSPIVGNVRGRGFFWGVEFVKDKASKEPFDPSEFICVKVHERALELGVSVYPGNGCAGNGRGDQVMIAPPFNITEEELRFAVSTLARAVNDVARKLLQ